MTFGIKTAGVLAFTLTIGFFITGAAFADDDRGREGGREKKAPSYVAAPENALYRQECSSCHFLYQPWLLPERSWQAIMDESAKHFGENLALDEETDREIRAYLKANSSDKTAARWARKITSSSEGMTPRKIMDVPWIKKEHREVSTDFKKPSIGSSSNCGACHTRGAEGNFEEDFVKIPK